MQYIAISLACLAAGASAFAPGAVLSRQAAHVGATVAQGEVGSLGISAESGGKIFDPLGLSTRGSDTTLCWFRAAELKHGRVAMLATVGWIAQEAGYGTIEYPMADGSWSTLSKYPLEANEQLWKVGNGVAWLQIFMTIGIIELVTEVAVKPHYMTTNGYIDIFGFQKATTSGKRLGRDLEAAQTAELKNGRLAMIGIASFYSAATLEGSVPALPFPF